MKKMVFMKIIMIFFWYSKNVFCFKINLRGENYIKNMKASKSVHSDVSIICFVKHSAEFITLYLSQLFNIYLEFDVFPEFLIYYVVVNLSI